MINIDVIQCLATNSADMLLFTLQSEGEDEYALKTHFSRASLPFLNRWCSDWRAERWLETTSHVSNKHALLKRLNSEHPPFPPTVLLWLNILVCAEGTWQDLVFQASQSYKNSK